VLALALHGAGMLGKFFADAIEEIDQGPLEACAPPARGRCR
jgi:phosphonate transport system permease protein